MRYLLILVVACSPLAALTGWSLWQATAGAAPAAANASQLDAAAIAKRTSAAAERAKADQSMAQSLAETDLLETDGQELADPPDAKLKAVAEAWNASRHARGLAAKYAKIAPARLAADASPAIRRREVEAALARLRDFISIERQNYVGQVEGADDFFAALDRRVAQLEAEADSYRRKDTMAEAIAGVQKDLEQGRYDACLKLLDTEPLSRAADPDVVAELGVVRKRAEYRRAWELLDARRPAAGGDRDLYNDIVAFLRQFPDPPTPAEGDLQAQIERRRGHLKNEISVHDLDQAADLDTLLTDAARIVADNRVEEPIKQQARHQVTDWLLNRGFPRIEAPASLFGKQEALTKSGQRKIGIFFLPPGVEQYRFWTDRRQRDKLRQGQEQIPRSTLQQPPATPQYVAWAEQYSQGAAKLTREAATRGDWQEFADACDAWQQQLASYREQWGIDEEPDRSCRDWSFRDAAATARNVLRHWTKLEQVLAR